MTEAHVLRILREATAGAGRSSWLASAPPIGLALLAVLYAWISGIALLGDALLILIKVAAALLAVAWAAAALPRRFGRARPRAVVAALALRDVVRVRKPGPAMLERPRRTATLLEAPTDPVELRIALAIAPGEDADAAAALATKAMTEMTYGQGIPAAMCTPHHAAAGGAVLDIRFYVRDLRRGRAHVLADAQALLWDVLHAHRIPFAPVNRGRLFPDLTT